MWVQRKLLLPIAEKRPNQEPSPSRPMQEKNITTRMMMMMRVKRVCWQLGYTTLWEIE